MNNTRNYLILDVVRSSVLYLSPTESILASVFFGLLAQNPIQYRGEYYYFADYKNVAQYCALLPDKPDTLRRLYKNLANLRLITLIKIDGHICFAPSDMLRDWGTVYEAEKNPMSEIFTDDAEKNPVKAEKNPIKAEKNPIIPYISNIKDYKVLNKDSENEFSPTAQTIGIESSLFTEEKKEKISGQKEKRATTGTREVKKCTFADSRYSQYDDFAKCFTAPEFAEVDLVYYYHAVADWSAANDAKKVDWIATARGFIRRDNEAGKLHKMTPAQSVFGLDVEDAISFIKGDL